METPDSVYFAAWGTFTRTPAAWAATRRLMKPALIKLLREEPAVARIGLRAITFFNHKFSTWQLAIVVSDIYRDLPILYDCPFAQITLDEVYLEEALNPKPKPPKPPKVKVALPPKPRKIPERKPTPPAKHGTMPKYRREGCRCRLCCAVAAVVKKRYRITFNARHPKVKKPKRKKKYSNPGGWKFDTE